MIKLKDEDSPRQLSAADTHTLLNLLYVNRADILEANEAVRQYVEYSGSKHKRKSYV